jgi:hypothetical protein
MTMDLPNIGSSRRAWDTMAENAGDTDMVFAVFRASTL